MKGGTPLGNTAFETWKSNVEGRLKFGPGTPNETQGDLTCLLYAMRLVVAVDPKKPGVMKGFEGKIELRDPNVDPVKCHHRRYTPKERAIIQKEQEELLRNGMIKKSDSPWSAPVVLVRKQDNKWRFCVNYTATANRFLRHDALRLPKAYDVLDALAESTMLSLWDVCSGYWHIKLREQDRKYTAFTTDEGLWQWTRLPFGLDTSGSQFVRRIEQVLKRDHPDSVALSPDAQTGQPRQSEPILNETVKMFVDDGTIYTGKMTL